MRRRYPLRLVGDLDARLVDWEGPDGQENSIGSLLYHIADVEMGWLFGDLKGLTEPPPAVLELLPFPGREPDGKRLTRVLGAPLAEHVARLNRSREIFLKELAGMSSEEWRRPRPEPQEGAYEVTPEWVVLHLVEHEAGHAFQISSLKTRGVRMLAGQDPKT